MELKYLPIFVYGTLRPGEANYSATLRGRVLARGGAQMPGTQLLLTPAYPFLRFTNNPQDTVTGELLLLHGEIFAEAIAELDELEGYIEEGAEDNLYIRIISHATVADPDQWEGRRQVECYVYVASAETLEKEADDLVISSSGDWTYKDSELDEA
ncbi:MAG: gamma-glutamylcyclotransferase family protein [Actinomycetaceae bacterium]|nr:gamma-glutamylcyclotransferase family protein [Actinomycetaceae bacterium]